MRDLTPEPLTAEAFAPFGSVIEASDAAVKLDINQGHAVRYDALAEVDVADGGGFPVISLFRARPLAELVLRVFERHPLGSQAFFPLSGKPYLVAVAPAGPFDPAAIRLFRAEGHQGVHYRKGTWHHFLLVLEDSDFLVVDRAGPGENCEEIALAPGDEILRAPMMFTKRLREPVMRGEVTCSVRIWQRPHVKVGGRYPLGPGAIHVTAIREIGFESITPDLARRSGFLGVVDLLKVAKHGPGEKVYLVEFEYRDEGSAPFQM